MSEYSCVELGSLATKTETYKSTEESAYRLLILSPNGVTCLINAQNVIPEGAIKSVHISDKQIGNNHICNNAVGEDQIANSAVTSVKIADNSITNEHISPDANISYSKISGLGSAALYECTAFSASDHTHNYAASNSVGGAANCAAALCTEYICFGTNCIWIGE